MGILKKRKSKASPKAGFEGLKMGVEYVRSYWVKWMNAKTASFSKSNWIVLLSVLVLGGSLYNGLVIFKAFEPSDKSTFKIQKIKPPDHFSETGEPDIRIKRDSLTMDRDENEFNKKSELWKNK
ncbi:hypothetical protein E6C50_01810 [Flavobacterium supellecticarium]|uniref:Uncharacterized protein n=1 Tax=Flavobacterium supellecticarium TaxID=2565924 RepID=A0A4S4A3U2_9FLAO|nr:hypothetical protein [Flavobacterium supellecticarium]THF52968.1 hypothetical protein E6C50_01810 [Flavobacterium supellecticarium]